jgi:hypothetical protein
VEHDRHLKYIVRIRFAINSDGYWTDVSGHLLVGLSYISSCLRPLLHLDPVETHKESTTLREYELISSGLMTLVIYSYVPL